MTRRINVSLARMRYRESQSVANLALLKDFVVTHQPGKDRHARRIRRGPAFRPYCVRIEIEDCTALRVPTRAGDGGHRAEHLVELPSITIDHDHVSIAIGIRTAFNRRIARHGIRTRIALLSVRCEIDADGRLRSSHHDVRNTVWRATINRSKIRVQLSIADRGNQTP